MIVVATGGRNRFPLVRQSLQDLSRLLYTQILWLPCILPSGGTNQTAVFQRLFIRFPTGCLSRPCDCYPLCKRLLITRLQCLQSSPLHESSSHHHRFPTLNGITVIHCGVHILNLTSLIPIFRLIAIGHATSPTISSSCYHYASRPHQYTHRTQTHIHTPHILGYLIAISPNTPMLSPYIS